MPRKWTREERKRHIREKYYSWKEKAFTMVIFFLSLLLVLYLVLTGAVVPLAVQAIAGVLVILIMILGLLVSLDDTSHRAIVLTLIALFLIFSLTAVFVVGLSGVERFVGSILLGILFFIILAAAVFLIDLVTYESG